MRQCTPSENAGSVSGHLSLLLRRSVLLRHLITKSIVLIAQPLALLLQGLNVPILLRQLLLELANLTELARLIKLVVLWLVAFHCPDFLLQTQSVEDHDIGAVEDEREEEREAAEVHVALGVEFARLDFHAFAGNRAVGKFSDSYVRTSKGSEDLPAASTLVLGLRQLDLDTVDPVDAVDEEDQDEYECDLPNDQLVVIARG